MTMIVCIVGVNVNCRYRLLRLTQIGRDLTTRREFSIFNLLSFNSFLFFFNRRKNTNDLSNLVYISR